MYLTTKLFGDNRNIFTLRETNVVIFNQESDALKRAMKRDHLHENGRLRPDQYEYNSRNELTYADVAGGAYFYVYSYDNIGNRKTSYETWGRYSAVYTTNPLNQYTEIRDTDPGSPPPFHAQYDLRGNQTLLQTSTGDWTVTYNAENRPVLFKQGPQEVHCAYDFMGRRFEKKIIEQGQITSHERYLYRGYLQIAALNLIDANRILHTLLWDPSQPVATRPLALHQNGNLYIYGWDLNKNVTELFDEHGMLAASFEYTPYGKVLNSDGPMANTNKLLFSSEVHDPELNLIYYNFHHYNPNEGRWISRDLISEKGGLNLYGFVKNDSIGLFDIMGLKASKEEGAKAIRASLSQLEKECDCCVEPNTIKSCKDDAKKIVEAMAKSWEKNWGTGPGDDNASGSDTVGGYFCWDWANGFKNAAESVKSSIWENLFERYVNISRSTPQGTPVHYAVKIKSANPNRRTIK